MSAVIVVAFAVCHIINSVKARAGKLPKRLQIVPVADTVIIDDEEQGIEIDEKEAVTADEITEDKENVADN